ncbi:hypothetical protein RB213_001058 [Colletotrichum asianum]
MASVNGHGLFQRRLPPTLNKAIPFVRLRLRNMDQYSGISAEEPRTHNAALLVGISHGTNLQFTYTISLD